MLVRFRRRAVAAVALTLVLPAGRAAAQDAGPVATDRPGFAFSPVVVPAGAFQVEVGTPLVTRSGGDGGSATLLNLPTGLRYGLLPRLELRVNTTAFNRLTLDLEDGDDPDAETRLGDVELGVKYQVLTAEGRAPNVAVIPSVVVPVGDDGFSAGDPVVGANAVAGFAFPNGLGLTLVGGATIPTADGARANANLVALLGRSFTAAFSGYVEAAAFPTDGATPVYGGVGVAYLVARTVQLDAALDVGLTDDAADLVGGVGVSFRLGR